MSREFLDITSMLGCRVRLHELEHGGIRCLRLSLDVDERHAEVLLEQADLDEIEAALREWRRV